MKKFLSILFIAVFAVALVFAQEKVTKAPHKGKMQKMECCKEGMAKSGGDCCKMKSTMKGTKEDCMKQCEAKKDSAIKDVAPQKEGK